MKKNIAVFASGGGSNLQAIIDACKLSKINAKVCVVICNNKNAHTLQRAADEDIPAYHLVRSKNVNEKILGERDISKQDTNKQVIDKQDTSKQVIGKQDTSKPDIVKHNIEEHDILSVLQKHDAHIIFLAGYLKKISPSVLTAYETYNIHPSLLPKYGGKGMYGINVHTAVISAGEKETGITIHRVDPDYDTGPIIAQRKIPVLPDDTPETLAKRVLEQEHIFIVEVLQELITV